MQKLFLYLILLVLPTSQSATEKSTPKNEEITTKTASSQCQELYTDIGLDNVVNYQAFEEAYTGYLKVGQNDKHILTLIDFTQPSTKERLFVIDLKKKKVVHSSLVSHGKMSGDKYATSFSNSVNSHKSSLGFYMTENTYKGKNGYSLVLNGLEKGINDKARQRAIVIHGADYCDPSTVKSGRLGRSFGCPALPRSVNNAIINTIKNGTLLFIYANNQLYRKQSQIL